MKKTHTALLTVIMIGAGLAAVISMAKIMENSWQKPYESENIINTNSRISDNPALIAIPEKNYSHISIYELKEKSTADYECFPQLVKEAENYGKQPPEDMLTYDECGRIAGKIIQQIYNIEKIGDINPPVMAYLESNTIFNGIPHYRYSCLVTPYYNGSHGIINMRISALTGQPLLLFCEGDIGCININPTKGIYKGSPSPVDDNLEKELFYIAADYLNIMGITKEVADFVHMKEYSYAKTDDKYTHEIFIRFADGMTAYMDITTTDNKAFQLEYFNMDVPMVNTIDDRYRQYRQLIEETYNSYINGTVDYSKTTYGEPTPVKVYTPAPRDFIFLENVQWQQLEITQSETGLYGAAISSRDGKYFMTFSIDDNTYSDYVSIHHKPEIHFVNFYKS